MERVEFHKGDWHLAEPVPSRVDFRPAEIIREAGGEGNTRMSSRSFVQIVMVQQPKEYQPAGPIRIAGRKVGTGIEGYSVAIVHSNGPSGSVVDNPLYVKTGM